MNEPVIDDARLAALLDGRLDAAEREQALARIADSDDDYQVFADAAAILREHEAQGVAAVPEEAQPESPEAEGTRVIPLRRRARAWPTAAWGALAAVLVAVALIPVLRARAGDPYDPARLAARVDSGRARLPAGWTGDRPWPVPRGGGPPRREYSDEMVAARVGALMVDLEVAVRSRDTTTIAPLAQEVGRVLNGGGSSSFAAPPYDTIASLAGEPPQRLAERLKDARQGVSEILLKEYVDAGAWTEAALLAAAARDEQFLRRRESRAEIDRIARMRLGDKGRAAAERVRDAMAAERALDWTAVYGGLRDVLRALSRDRVVDEAEGSDPAL